MNDSNQQYENVEVELTDHQQFQLIDIFIANNFSIASQSIWNEAKEKGDINSKALLALLLNESVNRILSQEIKKCQIPTDPSWEQIHSAIKTMTLSFSKKYDVIIGLSRGGLIPAVLISHILRIPMIPVCYSSKNGAGDNKDHSNVVNIDLPCYKSALIVDDIADSGLTLKEISEIISTQLDSVDTAVLYHKESSVFVPTYSAFSIPKDSPFINFPWEQT